MTRRIAGIAVMAIVAAVYVLRLDDTAGLYKDDAYYIVLARALADGQGYALINSAATPLLPAFPPGFALLLAPIVAVAPDFPDNVVWLKALSIAAMFAAGWLTFRYLHAYREIDRSRAAAIALLTTLTPGFVFLATSTVMSECAFTLVLMGSAVALERAADARRASSSRVAIVVAAVATTAAYLIRGSGIALIGGGALFVLWKRGWRVAAGFVMVCGMAYAPWYLYDTAHRPAEGDRAAYGGDVVRYYHSPLVSRGEEPGISADIVAGRIFTNFVNVFGRDVGAAVFPAGYRGPEESGLEVFLLAGATGLRAGSMGIGPALVTASAGITAFVLIGAITLARRRLGAAEFFCVATIGMLLLISSHQFRYVLPIAPFLIGYFVIGIETAVSWLRAGAGPSAFRIASGCLLFFLVTEHGRYIWMKTNGPAPIWIEDGREVRAVTDFVDLHLPPGATAVSTNPGLLYLMTGHRALVYVDPGRRWDRWKAAGIRYAVALNGVPPPSPSLGYRVLYESPRVGLWVLDLDPGSP